MIGIAIYEIASNDANITSMIDDRIYPVVVPEKVEFPAAVYTVADDQPNEAKEETATISNATVQIKAMHPNFKQAQILGNYIRVAFDGVKGTYNGVDIETTKYQGTTPVYDEQARVFQVVLTFNFFYQL